MLEQLGLLAGVADALHQRLIRDSDARVRAMAGVAIGMSVPAAAAIAAADARAGAGAEGSSPAHAVPPAALQPCISRRTPV